MTKRDKAKVLWLRLLKAAKGRGLNYSRPLYMLLEMGYSYDDVDGAWRDLYGEQMWCFAVNRYDDTDERCVHRDFANQCGNDILLWHDDKAA